MCSNTFMSYNKFIAPRIPTSFLEKVRIDKLDWRNIKALTEKNLKTIPKIDETNTLTEKNLKTIPKIDETNTLTDEEYKNLCECGYGTDLECETCNEYYADQRS